MPPYQVCFNFIFFHDRSSWYSRRIHQLFTAKENIYIRKISLYINIAQKLKWNAVHYFLSSYIINFMIFLVSYVRYPFDSFCFKLLMDFFVQKSCTIWSYIVCVCPHRTQYLFWFQTILKKINIYFCIGISMGTTVRWNAYTV